MRRDSSGLVPEADSKENDGGESPFTTGESAVVLLRPRPVDLARPRPPRFAAARTVDNEDGANTRSWGGMIFWRRCDQRETLKMKDYKGKDTMSEPRT